MVKSCHALAGRCSTGLCALCLRHPVIHSMDSSIISGISTQAHARARHTYFINHSAFMRIQSCGLARLKNGKTAARGPAVTRVWRGSDCRAAPPHPCRVQKKARQSRTRVHDISHAHALWRARRTTGRQHGDVQCKPHTQVQSNVIPIQ